MQLKRTEHDLSFKSLGAIPDEILEIMVLNHLSETELCSLAQVSHKFSRLLKSDFIWRRKFIDKFGKPTPLTTRAAAIAGSWKNLFAAKCTTERQSKPWTRPCKFETQAAIEKLTRLKLQRPERELHVLFLLDGSDSVYKEEFSAITTFVTDASRSICKACPGSKIGIVQFSNSARIEHELQKIEDIEEFSDFIRNIRQMDGGTNVALAIQKASQLFRAQEAPAGSIKQLLLLTDGRVDTNQSREARREAERLASEQDGVTMFAYGVGRRVDKTELLHIIGGPLSVLRSYSSQSSQDDSQSLSFNSGSQPSSRRGSGGSLPLESPAPDSDDDITDRYLDLLVKNDMSW